MGKQGMKPVKHGQRPFKLTIFILRRGRGWPGQRIQLGHDPKLFRMWNCCQSAMPFFVASFSLYLPAFYYFSSGIKTEKTTSKPASRPRIGVPKEIFERLSPYNWDFRNIPKPLLQPAIRAEYLRSWPEFRTAAIAWLEKKIDDKTIRQHIFEYVSKGQYGLQGKVGESLPDEQRYGGPFLFLEHDPVFPIPFAWLIEKRIIKERERRAKPIEFSLAGVKHDMEDVSKMFAHLRLVQVNPMNKSQLEYVSKMLSFPESEESFGYHMQISFDMHRNEDLVKAFAFWLKEEAKKKRKVLVHGKASSTKWHRLKQLAAKRLSDAGLNYKDARRTIAEREKASPLPTDYNKVLPKYNSAGAWHDAVKKANLFVETMKKNLQYENWELL
jgi:hypothetical protein